MAAAGALEMYRLYGEHPEKQKKKPRKRSIYSPIAA
jgi:hypothetical protein